MFKLLKAASLVAVGIGAIKLLHKDLSSAVLHWAQALRVDPDNRYIHGTLVRIFRVTPKQSRELSVGTFIYAGLFFDRGRGIAAAEALGGIFHHHYTGLFIPLEV